MINLRKLFKRKKGQGALEYLFMIAAALIIIFVVVRYISGAGQQATGTSDIAALQSQAELVKSSFQAKGWWETAKIQVNNTNLKIITSDGNVTYTIPSTYEELYNKGSDEYSNEAYITTVYTDCQAGKLIACEVFGVISSGST
ncbi:class III signal peptide-containing protein [Thermococcus sibiricus]|uniref:Class III signal peptide-containing protein n=1 Tax=Thermococcus sibiricus (strain DSM 12597 / MM 739) TaxID=604354 RepID=C6A008_THESM|nr:class III signal peptide-containing protein [Thermococcus sibiricus]ACS90989.1 hypothetical protein TSIB_1940 [Thermococcus sibiricus MM 739]